MKGEVVNIRTPREYNRQEEGSNKAEQSSKHLSNSHCASTELFVGAVGDENYANTR